MSDVTSVNTTSSGRVFITGQSTGGIDTNALIEASYQQRLQPAVNIDSQVEQNVAKSAAYTELQSLTNQLATSVRNLSSTRGDTANAFDSKTGSILSGSATSASSLISVGIDPSAVVGSYEVEVLQTAERMVVTSASQASNTDALGFAGEFSIGIQGDVSANINVLATDSLNDIADKVNAQSVLTGVTASVLLVAPGQYQLSFGSVSEALIIEAVFVSGANVLQSIGTLDEFGQFAAVAQAAQAAEIRLNGVQIIRNSNDFSDLIEGVDLQVRNAEPGNVISIEIEEDPSVVKDNILAFVQAYQALRDFTDQQQSLAVVEGAGASAESALFGDGTLRNLNREITGIVNSIVNFSATSVRSLNDIGISLNAIGDLTIDESLLDTALLTNFEEVKALFETNVTVAGAGDQAALVTNNYQGQSASFTIDVTTDAGGDIVAASVNGDSSLFVVDGNRIRGVANGPYEGLTFAYLGTTDVSLDINIASGLADRLDNTLTAYADPEAGVIQENIRQLDETNETLTSDAARIRERADVFLDREIQRYSRLEAAVSQAKTIQNFIKEILGVGRDDD